MASVEITKEVEGMLHKISSKTGMSDDKIVQEAVLGFLEDVEDISMLEEAEKNPGRTYTLEEVRRELGLED
jgi:RHH-type rel operon transcriptional repressor/antitoxin RelB